MSKMFFISSKSNDAKVRMCYALGSTDVSSFHTQLNIYNYENSSLVLAINFVCEDDGALLCLTKHDPLMMREQSIRDPDIRERKGEGGRERERERERETERER